MSLENNIILDVYSILIILVILFHALKFIGKASLQDRLFKTILYAAVFMLCMDICSRFDGDGAAVYPALNTFGNFMIFLTSPVLPSLWFMYAHFQVYRDEKRTKRLLYPLCAANILNAVILVFSQFYGWYYNIDSDNIYHRGPFFLFPAFIVIGMMIAVFTLTVRNCGKLERRSLFSLLFIPVPPFISIILQICFYGVSLMLNSFVLSLLIVFLNLQNHSMNTDHLTGVNNRKKLDAYLKEKVNAGMAGKGFSAILLDIDNFKDINDTYGHDVGDNALETTANLLRSCLRTNDFIARFGGDEFCIVLDISEKDALEELVSRLKKCTDKYNEAGCHPYRLGFSMGYAVYDRNSRMSAEEFLKRTDILMYEEKALKSKTLT